VEHGHQRDPDAAFYPNEKEALEKRRLSAYPLASLITRVLLSHIPRFELRGDNHTVPLRVLARVVVAYRLHALAMILRFPIAGLRIVWQSLLAWSRNDASASHSSMGSPWHVGRRLFLDRYFGTVALLALLVVAALRALPIAGWMGVAALAAYLAVPPRRIRTFAHRDVAGCRIAATRIAETGCRLVIFGHTHVPAVEEMEDHWIYANHGAFSIPTQQVRPYLAITPPPRRCSLRGVPCTPARVAAES